MALRKHGLLDHNEASLAQDAPSKKQRPNEPICTVGIDFGTSRTGYAFSFKNKHGVIICKEPGGQEATKTNTALLLSHTGQLIAFGSKAQDRYYESEGKDLLFERFKMGLHYQNGQNANAQALNGQSKPLLDVISKVLEFVKEEAMTEINKAQLANLSLKDILWVITVPAIWSDTAKGAMRRAALRAGIIEEEDSSLLELALEPEAACVACENENMQMKKNDTFMVLDCGGGTVDITMHRVIDKEPVLKLNELCPPSGGPWGSTFVDIEFENFISDLVGAHTYGKFKPSPQWLELMKTWEQAKLSYSPSEGSAGETYKSINVSSVLEFVEKGTLTTLVNEYNQRHGTKLGVRGRSTLQLPGDTIQSFFKTVITKIVYHVRELLQANDVKYIFLVGGFAESKFLLHRIRTEFEKEGRRVVVPLRPGLAVVQGAVMLGLGASDRFVSRMARQTYGIDTSRRIEPKDIRSEEKGRIIYKTIRGSSVPFVTDIFSPIVKQGTRVALNEVFQEYYMASEEDRTVITRCTLFISKSPDAKLVTDDGVRRIGKIQLPTSPGDKLCVKLFFGKTELKAVAVNKTTGAETPARIEYDFSKL